MRLGLRFVPFPGPSSSGVGECDRRGLSPFLPLLLSFLGGPLAPPVKQMMTVQHPPEVLAKEPACS